MLEIRQNPPFLSFLSPFWQGTDKHLIRSSEWLTVDHRAHRKAIIQMRDAIGWDKLINNAIAESAIALVRGNLSLHGEYYLGNFMKATQKVLPRLWPKSGFSCVKFHLCFRPFEDENAKWFKDTKAFLETFG